MRRYNKRDDIYWRKEAIYSNLKHEEFQKILTFLKENGHIATSTMDRLEYITDNTYKIDKRNSIVYIYCRYKNKLQVFYTNKNDNEKNGEGLGRGTKAIQLLASKFKEKYNVTFKAAFGYTDEEFKRCIPKSFCYINKNFVDVVLDNLSGIDGCSQYPSNIRGKLPDAHTAIIYEGTVKPTEEYPFAFYIKSGHVAEYNCFDTHDWLKSPFALNMFRLSDKKEIYPFNFNIKTEEDLTILMKPSKYELTEFYNYFYDLRKTSEDAKLIMNSSIGYFHLRNYSKYKLAHIVAIAIGRANNSILKLCSKIGNKNILHICVDGIIYLSNKKYGEDYKKLGIYHQEFLNCKGIIHGTNAYIIKTPDGFKVKHGGFNKNKDGSDISDETITDFNDVFKWIKLNPLTGEEEYGEEE